MPIFKCLQTHHADCPISTHHIQFTMMLSNLIYKLSKISTKLLFIISPLEPLQHLHQYLQLTQHGCLQTIQHECHQLLPYGIRIFSLECRDSFTRLLDSQLRSSHPWQSYRTCLHHILLHTIQPYTMTAI